MNLEELHEMGTRLERWLRMRVHPIAVKLLKNEQDVHLFERLLFMNRRQGR